MLMGAGMINGIGAMLFLGAGYYYLTIFKFLGVSLFSNIAIKTFNMLLIVLGNRANAMEIAE
jgi:hypothetical protein